MKLKNGTILDPDDDLEDKPSLEAPGHVPPGYRKEHAQLYRQAIAMNLTRQEAFEVVEIYMGRKYRNGKDLPLFTLNQIHKFITKYPDQKDRLNPKSPVPVVYHKFKNK